MDFEKVDTLPPVVGTYGLPLGWTTCRVPVYGKRWEFLPKIARTMFQVRVRGFGGLYWINVDERDVS